MGASAGGNEGEGGSEPRGCSMTMTAAQTSGVRGRGSLGVSIASAGWVGSSGGRGRIGDMGSLAIARGAVVGGSRRGEGQRRTA